MHVVASVRCRGTERPEKSHTRSKMFWTINIFGSRSAHVGRERRCRQGLCEPKLGIGRRCTQRRVRQPTEGRARTPGVGAGRQPHIAALETQRQRNDQVRCLRDCRLPVRPDHRCRFFVCLCASVTRSGTNANFSFLLSFCVATSRCCRAAGGGGRASVPAWVPWCVLQCACASASEARARAARPRTQKVSWSTMSPQPSKG